MKRIISYFAAVLLLFAAMSCIDEKIYDDTVIGEGEATLSAEVLFKNFTPALDGSRATDGDALDGIDNLYLFVYNENGTELLYSPSFQTGVGEGDIKVTNENTTLPSDGKYDPAAVTPTQRGSFDFKLPFGKYKIYAVANVRGDYVQALAPGNVSNETALKSVKFKWNQTTISDNDQMFGVFTTGALGDSPAAVYNAPVVTINQTQVTLRAWLRRLASKVTVAFDGSGLKDNVRIYIKSVRIKDIPEYCTLGASNTPGENDPLIPDGGMINYTTDDPNDLNVNWSSHTAGILISKKDSQGGSTEHSHTDENSLFFYENNQNNEDNAPGAPNREWYNKQQNADKVGQSIDKPLEKPDYGYHESGQNDYKDRKPYGTYIEVKAYYKSDNVEKLGEGEITYRFMLGKDVTFNYDAERNYHYKLTLKFINWANDPDWHIVFDEPTPTIITPNIYYISYLYNQQMGFPVRVLTNDGDASKYTLRAEIIVNNWAPTIADPDDKNYKESDAQKVPDGWLPTGMASSYNNIYGFAWNKAVYDGTWTPNGSYQTDYYKEGVNYVGFLSLRHDDQTIVGGDIDSNKGYQDPAIHEYLKKFYEGDGPVTPRYYALYPLNKEGINDVCGTDNIPDKTAGQYRVTNHSDGSVTATVPMFTRAKELVPSTDFTGNNPFMSYMRYACVRFTLLDENGKQVPFKDIENPDSETLIDHRDVPIFQVRRINNPKAIWREEGNSKPFTVKLLQRTSETAASETEKSFTGLKSRGPWRAYILQGPEGMFTLTRGSQTVTSKITEFDDFGNPVDPTGQNIIVGDMDDEINFSYNPTGVKGCGIIRIDYHDNTCTHLIFVRTGYDYGVTLGNAEWSCYNAYATNQAGNPSDVSNVNVMVTNSPLSIGSLFKRNGYNYAILEKNNSTYGWLTRVGTTSANDDSYSNVLQCAYLDANNQLQTTTTSWANIQGYAWCERTSEYADRYNRYTRHWAENWNPVNVAEGKRRTLTVPTHADYMSLIDGSHSEIEFGYGIAYADGATEPADNLADAFGYTDYDNDGSKTGKGMRVCVVYNKNNGDQILFPLGAIGQGRRARATFEGNGSASDGSNVTSMPDPFPGALTYSGLRGALGSAANGWRPLTYNLYRMPGAIYWFMQPVDLDANGPDANGNPREPSASWDINYENVVFSSYDSSSLGMPSYRGTTKTADATKANCSDALPIKLIYKK